MKVVTLTRGDELWEITWAGIELEIAVGPQGAEPDIEERVFPTPDACEAFAEAAIAEQRAGGWSDSDAELEGSVAAAEVRRAARPTARSWGLRRREPPPESEPRTRVGGRPLAPPSFAWPGCRQCGRPMQFLAQIRLADTGDAEPGDGLLLIFHCDESGGLCAPFEPDSGANLARVIDINPDLEPLAIPDAEPRRSRVLDRIDGVERVPLDRPIPLADGDDVDEDWDDDDDQDPYAALRGSEGGEIIGMLSRYPDWVQDVEIPGCPACRKPMRPVGQLEAHAGGGINFGDVGCGYAFVCTGCRGGAFLMQCH